MHEEHLPAALDLVADRLADDLRIELDDVGLNRQAVLGRRLDDGHVADADQRHVERPRDRRRAHREHVHLPPQLLDPLLVRDAEPLLLVHHQQAEIAELDVFRQQAMRPDDRIDLARGQIGQRLFLFGLAPEPADHLDADRKTREPFLERLLMLERQHGRRRQERDLLAVHHRLERRAHRHFRLAVADVAAQQAVHRRRRFHVALDVGDRGSLIGRQLVLERILELLLPVRVGAERVARHGPTRRVELEQLLGHVAHGLLDLGLRAFPRGAAQPIDGRLARAGVFLDEVEALDRNEELVFARVAELEELLGAVAHADLLEADEHADAVIDMDDEVADLEVAQIREERLAGRPPAIRRSTLFFEDVRFREDLKAGVGQPEAAREGTDGHEDGGVPRVFGALDRRGEDLVLLQELDGPLRSTGRRGHEQDGLARLSEPANLRDPVGDAARASRSPADSER